MSKKHQTGQMDKFWQIFLHLSSLLNFCSISVFLFNLYDHFKYNKALLKRFVVPPLLQRIFTVKEQLLNYHIWIFVFLFCLYRSNTAFKTNYLVTNKLVHPTMTLLAPLFSLDITTPLLLRLSTLNIVTSSIYSRYCYPIYLT